MGDCVADRAERLLQELEEEAPGWTQLQRAALPWLSELVQRGDLLRRDITVWSLVASRAELGTGEARVTCAGLAKALNYRHWGEVAHSINRLQRVRALQRVGNGRYMVSPRLLRVGGPERHRMWFARWEELQVECKRVEPAPQPRLVGAARASWLAKRQRQAQPA